MGVKIVVAPYRKERERERGFVCVFYDDEKKE